MAAELGGSVFLCLKMSFRFLGKQFFAGNMGFLSFFCKYRQMLVSLVHGILFLALGKHEPMCSFPDI